MAKELEEARRAVRVDAAADDLALEPHQLCLAHRAVRRRLPWSRAPGTFLQHGTHHLGNDITGLLHQHRVTLTHVLAGDVVLVVQRRPGDGGSRNHHRPEDRERRHRTGAADVDRDLLQHRLLLLLCELVRNRPARCPRDKAQLRLLAQVIDLDDDAVGAVVQLMALFAPLLDVVEHTIHGGVRLEVGVDTKAQLLQPLHDLGMAPRGPRRVHGVDEGLQIARGGDARVELAYRTGRGIARVGVEWFAFFLEPLVELDKRLLGHVHLAPHLDQPRPALHSR